MMKKDIGGLLYGLRLLLSLFPERMVSNFFNEKRPLYVCMGWDGVVGRNHYDVFRCR